MDTNMETLKFEADLAKTNAEIAKLIAETAKINAEARWYPAAFIFGGVIAVLVAAIGKFFH